MYKYNIYVFFFFLFFLNCIASNSSDRLKFFKDKKLDFLGLPPWSVQPLNTAR